MLKGKKVLFTGATGFIGANLIRKLLLLGSRVHIITRETSDYWRIQEILPKIREYKIELSNITKLKSVVEKIKPQIIYHLSAYGNSSSQQNVDKMIQANIIDLNNLLEALKPVEYECFVNTGTSSEYGLKNKPMKESNLLEPISYYAATKASGTLLCRVHAKMYNKPIVTLRPFSVYGYFEEKNRLIPTVITASLTGKNINLTQGAARHDFIFIKDVIEAYLKAASSKNVRGEVLNIGSGNQYTNTQVVKTILKLTKRRVKVNTGAFGLRTWDTKYWVADNSLTKEVLKWTPSHSFESGLTKTINWFKKNLTYYV